MFLRSIRYTAALLCAVMLITILAGCDVIPMEDPPLTTDFEAPYIDNYYVNKHEPKCTSGDLTIYKYDSENAPVLTIGGHDYRGGFVIESGWGSADLGCIVLPLDGLYKSISFVIGGHYSLRQMTIGEDGSEIYPSAHPYIGSYPTLSGQNDEASAGIQFLIDGKIADEFIISGYDTERRYVFDVSGAETFTFKVMADSGIGGIPVMELTVWEGEAHPTGHVPEAAPDHAVKLIRDLKPYLIPAGSSPIYYPSYTGGDKTVSVANTKYTDAILTHVSSAFLGAEDEEIYFNLEGKYSFLTFSAGAEDGSYDCSAWLTVYADGKKLLDETISAGELQKTFTLDVSGCEQLKFVWSQSMSGNGRDGSFVIADAYLAADEEILSSINISEGKFPERPVKIISELGVFSIHSEPDNAIYDGKNEQRSFKMAGRSYREGIILLSTNSLLLGDEPAKVAFNLGGSYEKVSFIAGNIDGRGVYKDEKLRVYADGVMIKEIDISADTLPKEYTVDAVGCRLLEFVSGLEHATSLRRPAIGIANLAAYNEGENPNLLFRDSEFLVFPEKADLIELFGFYDVRNPKSDIKIGGSSSMDGYFDGSGKNSFKLGNKYYTGGLILHTNTDKTPDVDSIVGSGLMTAQLAAGGMSAISLSSKGEARESAFAAANISGGGYTTLSFTASFLKTKANAEDETVLMVIADGKCIKELVLSKNMDPQSCTLDVTSAERLVFWLSCSDDGDPSHYYAIYDIALSK